MKIQRILCPVDFSDFNAAANEYASVLAKSTGAHIVYLHSLMPDAIGEAPEHFDWASEERRLLRDLEETFPPTVDGVESSYAVEFGSPSQKIVEFAKENGVDMIILGTHGRTGLSRVLMGSVAEAVVRLAECPVLAIKSESKLLQTG